MQRLLVKVIILFSVLCGFSYVIAKSLPQIEDPLLDPYKAPEIAGIKHWLHTKPISIADYHNKIVLLHFWTYSSINVLRSLNNIAHLQKKYSPRGLQIISIHTPEFEFEKNVKNVARAASKYKIVWPIGLDNEYRTWQNFQNNYWPGIYLINRAGYVVYQHFGEGDYAVTENNIRALLGIAGKVKEKTVKSANVKQTPETYMGYTRAERFINQKAILPDETEIYSESKGLDANHWGLEGAWTFHRDRVVAMGVGSRLKIKINADKVYAVLSSAKKAPVKVRIWFNGKLIANNKSYLDKKVRINNKSKHKTIPSTITTIRHPDLYQLAKFDRHKQGVLEIEALTPGVELYAMTFG